MAKTSEVIYNGACPICSREIAVYKRRTGDAVSYVDLNAVDVARYGLTKEQAAQSFHMVVDGEMLEGLAAFRALWACTRGFRWLAWLTGLPVVRPLAGAVYAYVLAPALYRMHLRRKARNG